MTGDADAVLRALARLGDELGPLLVPPGLLSMLEALVADVRALFGAAACSLAVVEDGEETLRFVAAAGTGAAEVVGMRIPVSRGIAGWVVASGEPLFVADVRRDPRFARDIAESTGFVPSSILATPVDDESSTVGVMEVLDRQADALGRLGDVELLRAFGRQAGGVIAQARVFDALGRALFRAGARMTHADQLARALEEVAAEAPAAIGQLGGVAGNLQRLLEAGDAERRLAEQVLASVASYITGRGRR